MSIAISTISNRIENLNLMPYDGIQYVIVHQDPHLASSKSLKLLTDRSDVVYVSLEKKGLAISRNIALAHASNDYIMIMDDDVSFSHDSILKLLEFAKRDNVDVATYYHKYTDGKTTLRKNDSYNHHLFNIANPSSIDICIRKEAILNSGIMFDCSFGLGSKYPSGEEMIFLADCLRSGLKVKRYPLEICEHPPITSGVDFFSTKQKILAKAAMFNRVYPKLGVLFFMLFVVKKLPMACRAGYGWFFISNAIGSLVVKK